MKTVHGVCAAAAVLVALAACNDIPTESTMEPTPSFAVMGVATDNGPHFMFLPPLVARAVPEGAFDGALSPEVAICRLQPGECMEVAHFTSEGRGSSAVRVDEGDRYYLVNWHTKDSPVVVRSLSTFLRRSAFTITEQPPLSPAG